MICGETEPAAYGLSVTTSPVALPIRTEWRFRTMEIVGPLHFRFPAWAQHMLSGAAAQQTYGWLALPGSRMVEWCVIGMVGRGPMRSLCRARCPSGESGAAGRATCGRWDRPAQVQRLRFIGLVAGRALQS